MEYVKLKELTKIVTGGTPRTNVKEYWENGNIPWLQSGVCKDGLVKQCSKYITSLGLEKSSAKMMPKNTVIIALTGATTGKVGLLEIDACANQSVTGILPNEKFASKYIFYYLQSIRHDILFDSYGEAQNHISQDYVKNILVPLPSVQDQLKIIDKIEELFSELDKAEETLLKIKSQLEVYKQAVLKEAFEGKLLYKHRKQFEFKFRVVPENEIKDLPKLPDEWRYVYLKDLGDLARGKSKHRPRNDSRLFEDGKYPFIQTGEVKAANNEIVEYHKMYGDFGLAQSKLWPKGTLCITIAANIAETAFLGFDACFPDSIVGFTPNKMVHPHYVKYFIEASKLKLWAFAPATAQKNINLSTLENLIVPYCDIEEQEYIVGLIDSKLTVFRSIVDTIEESIVKISSMRQSILKEAFEGKLL